MLQSFIIQNSHRFITIVAIICNAITIYSQNPTPDWLEITAETKPWTRWWWHGSSVTKTGLTIELEALQKAGFGGVEITPIFGVVGEEDQFINYLSPAWMEMLDHTLQEAERLGLGVDMATGTGWPFGGPWVSTEDAPKNVIYKTYSLKEGEKISELVRYTQPPLLRTVQNRDLKITDLVEPLTANKNLQALALDQVRFEKSLPLMTLVAYSEKGEAIDLNDKINPQGKVNWVTPPGNWTVYTVFQGWHGKMVERAAPGGEGYTIDHFSEEAIQNYLARFDSAFISHNISSLRSFFNDSYEVDDAQGDADWTPHLFAEFKNRRGYDLHDHLPALFGKDTEEANIRVLTDYRETISDLLLEKFTHSWRNWAHKKNAIIRNQAHGSPANILDLYAASDIPETEGVDPLMIKFAASAAHVTGKKLASAEAATWLNEHFLSSLADIRQNLERYFLNGINHIVYHGTAYSPQEDAWPGRLFYAAIHLNNRNPLWRDIPALNAYVARVQSFLQAGKPDNDILLYFPIHDRFAEQDTSLVTHFHGNEASFNQSKVKANAEMMQMRGFTFDYISDKQLQNIKVANQLLQTIEVDYQNIVIPEIRFMPLETFEKLLEFATNGATIIFHKNLPKDVPGLNNLMNRQKQLQDLKNQISLVTKNEEIQEAKLGSGRFLMGDDVEKLLAFAKIKREQMLDKGLQFIRRSNADGNHYFVVNQDSSDIDGWFPLSVNAESAFIFNPMTGTKGLAKTRIGANSTFEIYLQLAANESLIIKTFQNKVTGETYPYFKRNGNSQALQGNWTVNFIAGGPELPAKIVTKTLGSWTNFTGNAYQTFSGTATYTLSFPKPKTPATNWLLDIGGVQVSAKVILKGKEIGTLIGPNYQVFINDNQLLTNNILEIQVTNLMANRIIDLDKRGVNYKKFYNVNFPARLAPNRKNGLFDASGWEPKPSGLLGPVTLTPLVKMD